LVTAPIVGRRGPARIGDQARSEPAERAIASSTFRPIRQRGPGLTIGDVNGLLRSFWSEPRVTDAPGRLWRDWAFVALLAGLAVVEVVVREDIPYRWLSFVAALVGLPALLWRRTHPLVATCVVFGAAIAIDIPSLVSRGDPPGLNTMVYALVVSYALFRWGSGREALLGLVVLLVAASLALFAENPTAGEAIGGPAVLASSILLGLAVRYRTRTRAKEVDELRAREREGIARDLHDTVAHHVSAIAIRAQAGLATADGDPAAAVEALRVIDAEASRTLVEMRTIVRGLRNGDAPDLAPLPGLADIEAFATDAPGGPPVHVEIDGDLDAVPMPIATAAYRLVQESVTNARRHARHATRIDVRVRTGPDAVTLEVTDDGDTSARPQGSGFGIVGMIERAERLGGTCTAGPRGDAGWAVTAVLPVRGVSE
jgi:signal transduction histidine kinase